MYQHVCMFWFRMNNIHDNQQASKDERFSETSREINKDIVACSKNLSQIPVAQENCQIVRSDSNTNSVIATVFILCIWYSSKA